VIEIGALDIFPNPNAFAPEPLDRAAAMRADADTQARLRAHPEARALLMRRGHPVVRRRDPGGLELVWAPLPACEAGYDGPLLFLGLDGGAPRFARSGPREAPVPEGAWSEAIRAAIPRLHAAEAGMLAPARALALWHGTHGFCASCGQPTQVEEAGWRRRCSACGAQHFPRVDPVVIMLVRRDDDCLVGRQARHPPGVYSALAGYVEPGEAIDEAVRREVLEEAGVRVGAVRCVSSQPWPFPSTLMIGCFAEALSRDLHLDGLELEDARWLSRAEARAALSGHGAVVLPPPFAIAHHLIRAWAEEGPGGSP
jgi:NAD+ diphosphatase